MPSMPTTPSSLSARRPVTPVASDEHAVRLDRPPAARARSWRNWSRRRTRGSRRRRGGGVAGLPGAGPGAGDLFGIAVVSVAGAEVHAGDAEVPFTIMSVSKPFVFALACDAHGPERCAS